MDASEVNKLKKHLSLLREEYLKLQMKYAEVEKRCSLLMANNGQAKQDTFVFRLLKIVAEMFDKDLYSDLKIYLDGKEFRAHKFVLLARSEDWGVNNLSEVDSLDWRNFPLDISLAILRWIYTDLVNLTSYDDSSILHIIKVAKSFSLVSLVEKCEESLITMVNVRNCVKFYQVADEIGAKNLKNHCSQLISSYWNDFTGDDFAPMSAPCLFTMFKSKTQHPLHKAIRIHREDVVFLCLIEYDPQLSVKVNELDSFGDLPLDLALRSGQFEIARTLVIHKANVNATNGNSETLLHLSIRRKDWDSAKFLIENDAFIDIVTHQDMQTPLHATCVQISSESVADLLLLKGANANLQDIDGNTPLHLSILSRNEPIFQLLLKNKNISFEIRNKDGMTPLALALMCLEKNKIFADELVKKGASVDCLDPTTGDSLLHLAASEGNESAGIFLIKNGAKLNCVNMRGQTPLHIAASAGLKNLVQVLLESCANPNIPTNSNHLDAENKEKVCNQTPLHLAILNKREEVIQIMLKAFDKKDVFSYNGSLDLDIRDSNDEIPLASALRVKLLDIAQLLIDYGADVNVKDSNGLTLLHKTILNNDSRGALFLLNQGADFNVKTPNGESPLQLVVKQQLESVLVDLCSKGACVDLIDSKGNCPLWNALQLKNDDIASILVQYNCDTNCWSEGPEGCLQTLLHRALDENNEFTACFLIRNGCDLNSPRKPGKNGEGAEEACDGQTPLHMACCWGLERVVQTLIQYGANVNVQDNDLKTPFHIAIVNQHPIIISLLLSHPDLNLNLRDKTGFTPFATAMINKNNKAAREILNRDPNAAEKFDSKGFNFLHTAIRKSDIESVMFLLSVNVNIHSRVQDLYQMTPFLLAVESGSELIVRNLLLAGAGINEMTAQKQTALHIAAENDHSNICSILLEKGIDYNAVDINCNNALHIACMNGNLATCKVLLGESNIDEDAVNLKGQNPLHLVAQFGKENAAAIFDLFITSEPEYPINKVDGEGNTPLLLAYTNGNVNLCRALVKCGACLGKTNKNGINLFNCPVASNTLLCKLLDFLSQEPQWTEGDACSECLSKFGLTLRKHHCRHCGRVLCAKCSPKEITIPKFNINRSVRVCEICYDVLVMGFSA